MSFMDESIAWPSSLFCGSFGGFCVCGRGDGRSGGSFSRPLLAVCAKGGKYFVYKRRTETEYKLNADKDEPRTGGKGRNKRKETHKDAGPADYMFYVMRMRGHVYSFSRRVLLTDAIRLKNAAAGEGRGAG